MPNCLICGTVNHTRHLLSSQICLDKTFGFLALLLSTNDEDKVAIAMFVRDLFSSNSLQAYKT